jgi:dolichyl-phosphate-mannose--protein O-mannosyl transferase
MLNNVFGRQTLVDAFLLAVVLIGAYWIFSASADRVTPRLDEYRYVWRGRFFEYAFLERDLRSSRWGDRYSTHTQPMMANYVIGGWLWSRGYSLEDIPPVFDGEAPIPTNRLRGWVPDNSLIAEARKPMILVGASVIGLVYLLARLLAGRIAGLATACLAIGSPLAQAHLVRATSDPLLAFFVFLAVLVGMALIRVQSSGLNAAPWSIGLGIVLGLAVGTKLTALISICAVAVWPILASVIRGGAQRFSARASNGLKIGSPWVGAVGAAVVVFVLSNPHLYTAAFKKGDHVTAAS